MQDYIDDVEKQSDLHSNMDLLKLVRVRAVFRLAADLHSNMDLLKSIDPGVGDIVVTYLHSNMDLLKL